MSIAKASQMTDEQLRIAIAEWLGWTSSIVSNFPTQMRPPGESPIVFIIPKYTTDLNAVHEAEKKLDDSNLDEYRRNLKYGCLIDIRKQHAVENYEWHATARQRCIALVATIQQMN